MKAFSPLWLGVSRGGGSRRPQWFDLNTSAWKAVFWSKGLELMGCRLALNSRAPGAVWLSLFLPSDTLPPSPKMQKQLSLCLPPSLMSSFPTPPNSSLPQQWFSALFLIWPQFNSGRSHKLRPCLLATKSSPSPVLRGLQGSKSAQHSHSGDCVATSAPAHIMVPIGASHVGTCKASWRSPAHPHVPFG